MAKHMASIFGTEKDRLNCPFYFKIGACRDGDPRLHTDHSKPSVSPSILLSNMYQRPYMITPGVDVHAQLAINPRKMKDQFEDLFKKLNKYAEIESLNVSDNLPDHMESGKNSKFEKTEDSNIISKVDSTDKSMEESSSIGETKICEPRESCKPVEGCSAKRNINEDMSSNAPNKKARAVIKIDKN